MLRISTVSQHLRPEIPCEECCLLLAHFSFVRGSKVIGNQSGQELWSLENGWRWRGPSNGHNGHTGACVRVVRVSDFDENCGVCDCAPRCGCTSVKCECLQCEGRKTGTTGEIGKEIRQERATAESCTSHTPHNPHQQHCHHVKHGNFNVNRQRLSFFSHIPDISDKLINEGAGHAFKSHTWTIATPSHRDGDDHVERYPGRKALDNHTRRSL
jgi:hypothetical protein